jgi:hypothetical protein
VTLPWVTFLARDDFAPGDRREPPEAWHDLRLHVVESGDDPWFAAGFELLAAEFAARGELETREVLERRLTWNPQRPIRGCALLYRMMLLLRGDECVAVRDHTAILPIATPDVPEVVVHLSHSLVMPAWRRRGISAILRALPVATARMCASAAGRTDAHITLVAEMEPWDPAKPDSVARMRACEKAGLVKIDPRIAYQQPDFRPAAEIDASGGPRLLPLELVVWRVGREPERMIEATEVHELVRCLYEMYAVEFRVQDMEPCFEVLRRLTTSGVESYALLQPTQDA